MSSRSRQDHGHIEPIYLNRSRRIMRAWVQRRRAIMIAVLALALVLALVLVPAPELRRIARGLLARRGLVAMLLLFTALSLSLLWSAGQKLDAWAFLLINVRGPHPRPLDRAMWLFTQLGSTGAAAVLAAAGWATGSLRLAVEIVLGTLTLWLLVEILKALADRTRPYRLFAETRIIGWRALGASFPSGHTSQAFFLASLLIYHFKLAPWASLVLYVVAALVGFTRMYVGAHYPRDVLGGVIVGLAWGAAGALADQGFPGR